MNILAVDSSAVSAGCAILRDDKLISSGFVNVGLTHSQTLMPLISDTLRGAGMALSDIDYIAVSVGPGSFTGVRIGVATVKGIAFAQNIPCVAVSTLEAIAAQAVGHRGYVCAVMDARRSQVYNAIFSLDGGISRITEDRAISIAELQEELAALSGDIWLCGDGAELCYRTFGEADNIYIAPESFRWQSGYGVALAARDKILRGEVVDAASLMPTYLRLPQAERELNNIKKQQG
ncbi:MAG: tRNA (adenosine(37)-N6)-threonylcarbamoyltransferase complex dimerization subunit type 1 TsaB [Clostridia bacterium]|nr:tRNA (adenosine(37)-N6)-threonylcarbamoyltransferase complex dimerization subunit type 1 TsaB [Clostridia bacterium]